MAPPASWPAARCGGPGCCRACCGAGAAGGHATGYWGQLPTLLCRANSYAGEHVCQSIGGIRLENKILDEMFDVLHPRRWPPPPALAEADALSSQLAVFAWRSNALGRPGAPQFDNVEPENRLVARTLERKQLRPWAQLTNPLIEHRHPTRPTHPLSDHAGRHRRHQCQLGADRILERIHRRPNRLAHILRRLIRSQRRPHRVPRDLQRPGDQLDRQPLRSMQPADLSPILHSQQLPSPLGS